MGAQLAVCSRSDPQVVAELPVVQVVCTSLARLGVGRHLVTFKACLRELVHQGQLHVVDQILIRQHRWLVCKDRVGFDGELIEGQVSHAERESRCQVITGHLQGLPRQAVHQV